MIKAKLITNHLQFKQPAGTSRGVLLEKPTWYLHLEHSITGSTGIGECSIIPGLSMDDMDTIEQELAHMVTRFNSGEIPSLDDYVDFPAIQFAIETALADLVYEEDFAPYPGEFRGGEQRIPINGLIWMGEQPFMHQQIQDKIDAGFDCIKLKIGAIDFSTELQLLKSIRDKFSPQEIEIRVDANGAFSPEDALNKLERLSKYEIHSIEQPIATNQWSHMASLCAQTPIPIALDEELIGIQDSGDQQQMLGFIRPQYIILKPSLIGGLGKADQWISWAKQNQIGWWATSALESNIGLNAIAQWVSHKDTTMPQGLGTGKLFANNIDSPLAIEKGELFWNKDLRWDKKILG